MNLKFKNFKWLFFGILITLSLFIILYFIPDNMKFSFYIDETKESLEGDVYFEDPLSMEQTYLGFAKHGFLKYDKSSLYPGNIIFVGEYEGFPFEYYYTLSKGDLDYGEIDYILTEKDIGDLKLNVNDSKLRDIEKEIFDLVNLEREKYPRAGIHQLRWNDKISEVSRQHSEDLLEKEYFSHRTLTNPETLESMDFSERLKNENIAYLVSNENIIFLPIDSETDIAKESVDGWLSSPGHRSTILDLDNLYSDAGVGIACKGRICYVTMDFISLKNELINERLGYHYVQAIPLYPEGYGFDYNSTVNIEFSSSSLALLRLTKDKSDFNRIINRDTPEGIIWTRTSVWYKDTIKVSQDYYLLIEATNLKGIIYNLTIDYNTY